MPAGTRVDTRIFVVGFPRSGTTLVQSLLASHSALTSFTESHFFWRHFSHLPLGLGPVLTRNPASRLREFLAENHEDPPDAARWFDEKTRWALAVGPLLPFLTLPAARQLLAVLDALAVRRARSGWIEKTPKHLRYVSFLERVSATRAETHFVHVIRDGLEAVASLHEVSRHWEQPYDLDTCVTRWNADVGISLARMTSPRDHLVIYEDLTASPGATLERLLTALGLQWEPDILDRHARTVGPLATDQEPWKADVGRSIRPSRTADRVLTPAQQERARRSLRRDLYERAVERAGAPR
jgi:hypothetical protein